MTDFCSKPLLLVSRTKLLGHTGGDVFYILLCVQALSCQFLVQQGSWLPFHTQPTSSTT